MTEFETNYLAHHGIKGQKWGIRRFQNPDGTRTEAGKKRYGSGEGSGRGEKEKFQLSEQTKKAIKVGALVAGTALVAYGSYKVGSFMSGSVESDMRDAGRAIAKEHLKAVVADRIMMTDKELDANIKRLENQKKLKNLAAEELSPGEKYVNDQMRALGGKIIQNVIAGGILYGAKALAQNTFDRKEFGNALYNGGPKKK